MLKAIEDAIKRDIPEYQRKVKEESTLMWVLHVILYLFNPGFMKHYVTTVGYTVYVPRRRMNDESLWLTLAHEWVHMRRVREQGKFWFSFKYLLPFTLTPLALLSLLGLVLSPAWYLNLLWLGCLLPLPAYFRMREELLGYTMSMAAHFWRDREYITSMVDWYAPVFYASDYYFMWPFRAAIERLLRREMEKIVQGAYDQIEPFKTVRLIIEEELNR